MPPETTGVTWACSQAIQLAQARVALGQLLPEALQLLRADERLHADPLQEEGDLPREQEERREHRHQDHDRGHEHEERGGEGGPAAERRRDSALLDGREEQRDAGGHREDEDEGLEHPERQHEDDGEGQQERGEEVAAPSFGHGLSSEW